MMRNTVFTLLLFFSFLTLAADKQAATFSFSAGNWSQQIKSIELVIEGKEYSELSKESRARLDSNFDLLLDADFERSSGPDLEANINQILSKAFADSKLICGYEKPVGTNMKKRVCTTAAAKERSNEIARRDGISVIN